MKRELATYEMKRKPHLKTFFLEKKSLFFKNKKISNVVVVESENKERAHKSKEKKAHNSTKVHMPY